LGAYESSPIILLNSDGRRDPQFGPMMIHIAAIITNIVWFVITGLVWYAKPSGDIWLIASIVFFAIWCFGFYWYLMRSSKPH
jgi:hypothetical protein